MSSCVMCGMSLPSNQGSNTCSMCYGDIDHGKDGYYRQQVEDDYRQQDERRQQEQQQQED